MELRKLKIAGSSGSSQYADSEFPKANFIGNPDMTYNKLSLSENSKLHQIQMKDPKQVPEILWISII